MKEIIKLFHSSYGDILLRQKSTEDFCTAYMGEYHNEFVGEMNCSIDADSNTLENCLSEIF